MESDLLYSAFCGVFSFRGVKLYTSVRVCIFQNHLSPLRYVENKNKKYFCYAGKLSGHFLASPSTINVVRLLSQCFTPVRMDALELSLRHVRIDRGTGQASVKDVIWAVTQRDNSAATQVMKRLVEKHPALGQQFQHVRINGKGQETAVADFSALSDVIFLVSVTTVTAHVIRPLPLHDQTLNIGGELHEGAQAHSGKEV